jgi:hypothetical protein
MFLQLGNTGIQKDEELGGKQTSFKGLMNKIVAPEIKVVIFLMLMFKCHIACSMDNFIRGLHRFFVIDPKNGPVILNRC